MSRMAPRRDEEQARPVEQQPPPRGSARAAAALALALAALTLATYVPSLSNGFLSYDDDLYVVENSDVHGLSWPGAAWAFTKFHAGNWHPLTWLSHAADCSLYGLARPWGHHLTSILLHAANAALLLVVLRRLTGRLWASAAVAALFALHPLHVESVAWIAERKDVLCALCSLLAVWAYAAYVRRPALGRYLLVVLAFAAALMSKPMAVTLPAVLLLLDWWPLRRLSWRAVLEKAPLAVLAAASCALTLFAQRSADALHSLAENPLGERLASVPAGYLYYLLKMVWPVDLVPLYPMSSDGGLPVTALVVVAAVTLVLGVALVGWLERRRRPYLLVGWLWFLGMLVPVWNTLQVGARFIADRYTYLPLVGVFIGLVWLVDDFLGERRRLRRAAAAGAIALALVLAGLSFQQQRLWHDDVSLWQSVKEAFPRNPLAWSNHGRAVWRRQGPGAAEALADMRQATVLKPDWVAARVTLGEWLFALKRYDEVIAQERAALAARPDAVRPRFILAAALQNKGDYPAAIQEYLTVLGRQPGNAEACRNLAMCYDKVGNAAEAARYKAEAARLKAAENRSD